jgi:hypothetical protein
MRWTKSGFLVCGLVWLAAGLALGEQPRGEQPRKAAGVAPIDPEQLGDLKHLIKPDSREDRWARIPWQTSLWEARKLAAAQGKPILLWEMDGNPLGCT